MEAEADAEAGEAAAVEAEAAGEAEETPGSCGSVCSGIASERASASPRLGTRPSAARASHCCSLCSSAGADTLAA